MVSFITLTALKERFLVVLSSLHSTSGQYRKITDPAWIFLRILM